MRAYMHGCIMCIYIYIYIYISDDSKNFMNAYKLTDRQLGMRVYIRIVMIMGLE